MKTKIFLDSAKIDEIRKFNKTNFFEGFTTNPSLLKKNKVVTYKDFAKNILKFVKYKPVSLEVLSDDINNIYQQSKEISSWGKNVFVKIPIINSKGISNINIIKKLSDENIKINITAVFTKKQIDQILNKKLRNKIIISIFCGRIADTGRDPKLITNYALKKSKTKKNIELLWASAREVFNFYEAKKINCNIITLTPDLIKKISLFNKSLDKYSVETSKQFFKDSKSINF
jgi:transaldolase